MTEKALEELARLKLSGEGLAFVFFEFSALAVRTRDHNLLFDPAELLSAKDLSPWKPHFFLLTHEHFDHLEPSRLVELQRASGGGVICNPGSYNLLRGKVDRLVRLQPGETYEEEGMRITGIRAEHPGEDPLLFLVESGGLRLFHGSDSSFTPELKGLQVDVAFLPVGTPSPTASVEEALHMAKALRCRMVVPFHGLEEEMEEFRRRAERELPGVGLLVPEPGKVHRI